MAYYDKATSDKLKDKFKDLAKPTGADFSELVGYFDKGLQGMDENNVGVTNAPAFVNLKTQVDNKVTDNKDGTIEVNGSSIKPVDDSKVVHSTDMRKPASDVAGIEEVNTKQDKIGYTPADDSKVIHSTDLPTAPAFQALKTQVDNNMERIATPYQFGAKGDGVTDDTSAMQNMFDSGQELFFISGYFNVSKTLSVGHNCTLILAGTINASAEMDTLIKTTAEVALQGSGMGAIDLKYNANIGVLATQDSLAIITGLRVYNVPSNGIGIKTDIYSGDTHGYVHLNECTVKNDKETSNSIAVYTGRDSIYSHLETIDLTTGIYCAGWDVFINGFHPWNDIISVVNQGIGIHASSSSNGIFISNYYCDSMKYGLYLDADTSFYISNMLPLWNTSYYNEANNSGNPFIVYYSNDQLTNPGYNGFIVNSDFTQSPGDSIVPCLCSLKTNQIQLQNVPTTSYWNMPTSQKVIMTKNYGLKVTPDGFYKTTDGGATWIAASI